MDARPDSLTYPDGSSPSNRREPFDATFGLDADRPGLPAQAGRGQEGAGRLPDPRGLRAVGGRRSRCSTTPNPTAYWNPANPQNSVKVAGAGVTAEVTSQDGNFLTVHVDYPAVG